MHPRYKRGRVEGVGNTINCVGISKNKYIQVTKVLAFAKADISDSILAVININSTITPSTTYSIFISTAINHHEDSVALINYEYNGQSKITRFNLESKTLIRYSFVSHSSDFIPDFSVYYDSSINLGLTGSYLAGITSTMIKVLPDDIFSLGTSLNILTNKGQYNNLIKIGSNIYLCGFTNYNIFPDNENIVGNATILKMDSTYHVLGTYTFGSATYFSSFQSISTDNNYLYLSGFTEKKFEAPNSLPLWFTNPNTSKPYLIAVKLDKLQ